MCSCHSLCVCVCGGDGIRRQLAGASSLCVSAIAHVWLEVSSLCAPAIACVFVCVCARAGVAGVGAEGSLQEPALSLLHVPRTELSPQSQQQTPLPDELLASLTFFPFFLLLPSPLL